MSGRPDFASAYDEHVLHVHGFFSYRIRRAGDAEDLTQLTFEKAFRAWPRYDPARASVATWLLSIARNVLIDHYRADRTTDEQPFGPEHEQGYEPALRVGLSPELEQALTQLGDREREVLGLRFGADLNGPEIAELTGLSVANVQQILSRSLRKLRSLIEDQATTAASASSTAPRNP